MHPLQHSFVQLAGVRKCYKAKLKYQEKQELHNTWSPQVLLLYCSRCLHQEGRCDTFW